MNTEKFPIWWPEHPPIYDIKRSYLDNANLGPFFEAKIPERVFPPPSSWKDFLGFKVASTIGVPAGPLLNARWVNFAAAMGFDIVTYKTIRSKEHPAHPAPNMIYVDTKGFLSEEREGEVLKEALKTPTSMDTLAATNSFGIPSRDPDYLVEDIALAQKGLHPGQVMIVSIVGTPREGEDFIEDFGKAALLALRGGAQIIEADFSCPNVVSCEGSIHTNPDTVYQISKLLRKVIGDHIPLVIKVGVIADLERLEKVMEAAHLAGVDAFCGINTVSMKVVKEDGTPALGANRLKSGVCGGPIRLAALEFMKKCAQICQKRDFRLVLMGTGGVTLPEHFDLFFQAGAHVAMSAVGMMWDPFLAMRYHEMKGKQ